MRALRPSPAPQEGGASVEFAMVAVVFATVMLAIVEFGRWMTALEALTHATQVGARMAAVCDIGATAVKERMLALVPGVTLDATQIRIQYDPPACSAADCLTVRVEVSGASIAPAIPLFAGAFPLPGFPSTLTRESLLTEIDRRDNPRCHCGATGGNACV